MKKLVIDVDTDKVEDYDKEIKKLTAKRNKLKKANEKEKFDKNKLLVGKCFINNFNFGGDAGEYFKVVSVEKSGGVTVNSIIFYDKDKYDGSIDFGKIELDINYFINHTLLENKINNCNEIPFEEFLKKIQDTTAKSLENIFKPEIDSNGN